MEKCYDAIYKFIDEMNYLTNRHVLGIFFYGSFLTGYNHSKSDIDLHIIFDNSDSDHLIRGVKYVDDMKVEYFEKPLADLYLSADNDYENQDNALLSIIGASRIILDKTGDLKKLQNYVLDKYSKPLPCLESEDAREYVSILDNRMERLEKAFLEGAPYFNHLYSLTVEKIRKFYHRLNGISKIPTSKVYRIYTDSDYRDSFAKGIPDDYFVDLYLDIITMQDVSGSKKMRKINELYSYAKRNVGLNNGDYRIRIKSRNK